MSSFTVLACCFVKNKGNSACRIAFVSDLLIRKLSIFLVLRLPRLAISSAIVSLSENKSQRLAGN